MIIRFFRDKFGPRCWDNAGNSIFRKRIEGEGEVAVIGRTSGKLYAHDVTAAKVSISREPGPVWIGNEDEAALIDIRARKVLAFVEHDRCGKYYPTVYVSLLTAYRLTQTGGPGDLVSLRSLPRFTIELFCSRSMERAQEHAHHVLDGGS